MRDPAEGCSEGGGLAHLGQIALALISSLGSLTFTCFPGARHSLHCGKPALDHQSGEAQVRQCHVLVWWRGENRDKLEYHIGGRI